VITWPAATFLMYATLAAVLSSSWLKEWKMEEGRVA